MSVIGLFDHHIFERVIVERFRYKHDKIQNADLAAGNLLKKSRALAIFPQRAHQ
jgi:hypothetical protein